MNDPRTWRPCRPRTSVDSDARAARYGIGTRAVSTARLVVAWLLVGVPILWGVWVTLSKARVLFH